MQPTSVDPAELIDAAQAIGQCAEELGNRLNALSATLTSENPWGADEPGTLFGMAYMEVLGHALEVYGSHVDQLFGAAQGLAIWASTAVEADQGNAAQLLAIQSSLDG
jgi:hypothetical protein